MSVARHFLRYTRVAQEDFRHIIAHSENEWGIPQAHAYEDAMFAALDTLREHPLLGLDRPEIGPDTRSLRMQKHVIYYRVFTDSILILRILHQRQSLAGQFDLSNDE